MEELLRAAVAYYNNGSNDLRSIVSDFFDSMDTNQDGVISRSEFRTFLEQNGYSMNSRVFNSLDRDGDGYLEFKEVIALYYIVKTRLHHCAHCRLRLLGLYFTCVVCFDRGGDTYDLCCACYSARRFLHPHIFFMDNHMLLLAKRNQAPGVGDLTQAIASPAPASPNLAPASPAPASPNFASVPAQQPAYHSPESRRRISKHIAFRALETEVRVGNIVSACTIM